MKKMLSILILILLLITQSTMIAGPEEYKQTSSVEKKDSLFESIDTIANICIDGMEEKYHDGNAQVLQENMPVSVSTDDIVFHYQPDGSFSLNLKDGIPGNQPGLPLIPMRTFSFSLPKNACVDDILFEKASIRKSMHPVSFSLTPPPSFWSTNTTPLHDHVNEIIDNTKEVYQKKNVYPGKSHSYVVGKNATNTTVNIYFYPFQYDMENERVYLISSGNLAIYYTLNTETLTRSTDQEDCAENIIITPPRFFLQAQSLKQFHDDQGTASRVVTTTWIRARYKPSSYPEMQGYKEYTGKEKISGYEDRLARSIISFLQSQNDNPHLQFVTLLGNAKHVPPSYYFGFSYYPVPTDFYYSSPDLDLIPNYCVGRLPVNTISEARQVIHKIMNWKPRDEQMNQVAVAGGIPFGTPFYIGELITIDSVNRGLFDGFTIDKYYRSDERFDKEDVLSALGQDYGLMYMICHGSPFLIAAEEGLIKTGDIERMPEKKNQPILSCIACSSGSFDTRIVDQGLKLDKTSFGESIVISKGGAIAYIGGSRTNDGYPVFTLNKGQVEISKETYMAGLLTYVNQAYSDNKLFLGNLTRSAAETYLLKNDMSDFWNLYHYFSFVLLGDPALRLPIRSKDNPSYPQPNVDAVSPVGYARYGSIEDDYSGSIVLNAIGESTVFKRDSDSSIIDMKHIDTDTYEEIEESGITYVIGDGDVVYQFPSVAGEMMLLRFESVDKKEEWVYYKAARPVDDDFTNETQGINQTRWMQIQDAIDNADHNDPIYVFNGSYQPIIIDKPVEVSGEGCDSTVIDGQGYGNVVSIYSDGVSLSGFSIEHGGNNPDESAVYINPHGAFGSQSISLTNNQIQHNLNSGVIIDVSGLFTPLIEIMSNIIQYNEYGVYIKSGSQGVHVAQNHIYGNDYGLFVDKSRKDRVEYNTFENNDVGLVFYDERNTDVSYNNFIYNEQHCQFTSSLGTRFEMNYWDNWIGHLFKRDIRFPKIIDGSNGSQPADITQIKIDRYPAHEPYVIV